MRNAAVISQFLKAGQTRKNCCGKLLFPQNVSLRRLNVSAKNVSCASKWGNNLGQFNTRDFDLTL